MPKEPLEEIFKRKLTGNHSVAKVKDVAVEILSEKHIQALLNLIDNSYDYPTPEAAAWCIRHATFHLEDHHAFIAEGLITKLDFVERDSLIKNILGTYKVISIPPSVHGTLANYCLEMLTQPTRSKAVLYYSMEIMFLLCKAIPELSLSLIHI